MFLFSIVILLFTILPFLPIKHWIVRDLGFGRLQLLCLSILGLVISCIYFIFITSDFFYITLLFFILCVIINLLKIIKYTPFYSKSVPDFGKLENVSTIKLFSLNVLQSNNDFEDINTYISEINPDIVVLLETNSNWIKNIQPSIDAFPYRFIVPMENRYGITILSKFKLIDAEYKFLVEKDIPSVFTYLEYEKSLVRLIVAHPPPPSPTEYSTSIERDNELKKIATMVSEETKPTLVVGDLNDIAWSATTKSFLEISKLKDPRIGRGLYNTFNANHWWMRFPVDHLFVSKEFKIVQIKRSKYLHSDHFGLISEFGLEK